MRNLISLFASFLIAICGLSASAATISVANDDGVIIYYRTSGTNATVIMPTTGKYSGDIVIPSVVKNGSSTYNVVSIGAQAFYGSSIKSINIPSSVTSIISSAFTSCEDLQSFYGVYASNDNRCIIMDGVLVAFAPSGLTSYSIPTSVTSIGKDAFRNCSNLTSVVIPETVTSIGETAFQESGLTSIAIPESITAIGSSAFNNCDNLSRVDITDIVAWCNITFSNGNSNPMSQADKTYLNGVELTELTIPEEVTQINKNTFIYCNSLKSVIIPNSVTNIGSSAFSGSSLTTIDIPNSVTSIGNYAFSYCNNLESIEIPNSVTSIGMYAFQHCISLGSIKVDNENPSDISLGSNVFLETPTSTCTLFVPKGSRELYAEADQWKDFLKIEEQKVVFDLIDGEVYDIAEDHNDVEVTYTRNFTNRNWQAIYIPFNMSYDEWSPYVDVAMIYNVRCYDYDKDNVLDEIVIEFNRLGEGDEIIPNVPYVVRAKQKGTFTFECTGKTLMAAPVEPTPIECASTIMTYSFYGVYEPTTGLYEQGAYRLTGGEFCQYASANGTLSPYRFYMLCTPKTGGYNQASMPQHIKIHVIGDDEDTDSIDAIDVDSLQLDTPASSIYYDLMGRRVVNPTPGIYIHNGHKVLIK